MDLRSSVEFKLVPVGALRTVNGCGFLGRKPRTFSARRLIVKRKRAVTVPKFGNDLRVTVSHVFQVIHPLVCAKGGMELGNIGDLQSIFK
jgi:hypothetical protein